MRFVIFLGLFALANVAHGNIMTAGFEECMLKCDNDIGEKEKPSLCGTCAQKGDQGDVGAVGDAGESYIKGPLGPAGPQGATGAPGVDGTCCPVAELINEIVELEKLITIPKCAAQTGLRRVKKKCTNGNRHESVCTFTCENSASVPEPGSVMTTTCQEDGSWTNPPPCCRLPCPPNTIMDLFIVLDCSSSVRKSNWKQMIDFVTGIISSLNLAEGMTQVSAIRYNDVVDTNQQFLFNNGVSQDQVEASLGSWKYEGTGTHTGLAVDYVTNTLLAKEWNRPDVADVMLIITDGKSQDNVKDPANNLRAAGVETFAIGIGQADQGELLQLAGSADKLWGHLKDFDNLTIDAGTKIGQEICEKSCQ